MIHKILVAVSAFIIQIISTTGYPGIMLLMAIESACIPLPSEIIMPFSGALAVPAVAAEYSRHPFSVFWVATWGAIGCNLGSVLAYEVGYFGGRPLIERWGRYILLSERELDLSDRFFQRFGGITVFVARLLPVVRTFIALPAGIARMPRLRFHIYTFVGSWPWCFMLAYVGMRLGAKWESDPRLKMWFHRFDAIIGAVLVLGVAWFIWTHWKHRIGRSKAEQTVKS